MKQLKRLLSISSILSAALLTGCVGDGGISAYIETRSTEYQIVIPAASTVAVPQTEQTTNTETTAPNIIIPTVSDVDPISTEVITPPPQGDLTKHRIVIDPGHGGGEHGAVYNGYREKELTLKVGMFLQEYLLSNYSDIDIAMTRTEDVCFSDDAKVDLQSRCDVAYNAGAEYLISLHFNADGTTHTNAGALICNSNQPGLKEAGDALGNLVLAKLGNLGIGSQGIYCRESDTYFYPDGRPMDYYAINRHCAEYGIPSIIIEHIFIDNPSESIFIESDEKLRELAIADGMAIAEYFKLTKR